MEKLLPSSLGTALVRTTGQLGPYLQRLRKAHGWSQTQLGRRVGLSQERISSIERFPERVTFDQLLTILMALDAEFVVRRRDHEPPDTEW